MAVLTPTAITRTGYVYDGTTGFSPATVTTGDTVLYSPTMFLAVKNASGSSITVTIDTPGSVSGYAIADQTVTVATGTTQFIGPFSSVHVNDTGYVKATCSVVTTVTIAALQLA